MGGAGGHGCSGGPGRAARRRGSDHRGESPDGDHDGADPASARRHHLAPDDRAPHPRRRPRTREDRKSTRLNSSHITISYAVFCLKKKKKNKSENKNKKNKTKKLT